MTSTAVEKNSSVFQDLTALFNEILGIVGALSDPETKKRFADTFDAMDQNLAQVIVAKHDILHALEHDPCSAGGQTEAVRLASWQASQLTPLILKLSAQIGDIRTSMQSAEVRAHADGIVSKLLADEVHRYWSGDLLMYCRLSPDQQAAFLMEIQQSQTALQASSAGLRNLIAKLNP
ncbi:hypothetical protein [Neomesorhizobium albiziae]|nr:hypothetical protein [Mesorhizobium albiziae]